MRRVDLEHIIRASCEVANQDQVLIIGSQSVLGTYNEFELPETITESVEADVIPLVDDASESQADMIDGAIGEMSMFHNTYGYYAQGVGRRTALLPAGWMERLVPVSNENTRYFTGWCLDVHDLCCAKLLANREKDREFVKSLVEADLVSVSLIRSRLAETPVEDERREIADRFARIWELRESRFRPPDLPFADVTSPRHPVNLLPAPPQQIDLNSGPGPSVGR